MLRFDPLLMLLNKAFHNLWLGSWRNGYQNRSVGPYCYAQSL